MLVDVVQLRLDGSKRPREEERAEQPIRGHLHMRESLTAVTGGQPQRAVEAILNADTDWRAPPLIPPLNQAYVRSWRGADLVIVGAEFRRQPGTMGYHVPQAWWVRLVLPEG
jgi:hypothetical protein